MTRSSESAFFPVLILAAFFIFQCLFLTADSPADLTDDIGILIDEGFKTLDAKNLALYGKTHWSEFDEYPGWIWASPVTVVSNYLLFEAFGVSLRVARFGSILYALGTMILLCFLLTSLYNRGFATITLLILSVNPLFFFHSRVALHEIKMAFFMICTLFAMKLARTKKRVYGFLLPIAIAAAYYCKPTAAVFLLSLITYYILTCADGFLIRRLTRPRILFVLLLFTAASIYLFEYHFTLFSDLTLWGRPLRTPVQALLTIPNPVLFKKIPVLGALAMLYVAYLIAGMAEGRPYRRADVLFSIIFVVGLLCHSVFVYRPLRYYFVLLIPVVILATRALFSLPEIFAALFNGRNRLLKGIVFVVSSSFFVVFTTWTFLQRSSLYERIPGGLKPHIVPLALGMTVIMICSYLLLRIYRKPVLRLLGDRAKTFRLVLVLLVLAFHLEPIYRWSSHPGYELKSAAEAIDSLGPEVVIVGQWAPQLCVDTRAKSLYSDYFGVKKGGVRKYLNVQNLDRIRPDFLTFVEGINEAYVEEVDRFYPGVVAETPSLSLSYGGRLVELYALDFGSDSSSR